MRAGMSTYSTATDTTYTGWISGGTDWWNFARLTKGYGILSLVGIAFITQILATFGIVPELNGMIWTLGMGIGLPLLASVYLVFLGLAYEGAFGQLASDTANAVAISKYIETEFGSFLGMTGLLWVEFAMNKKAWTDGTLGVKPAEPEEEVTEEEVVEEEVATEEETTDGEADPAAEETAAFAI